MYYILYLRYRETLFSKQVQRKCLNNKINRPEAYLMVKLKKVAEEYLQTVTMTDLAQRSRWIFLAKPLKLISITKAIQKNKHFFTLCAVVEHTTRRGSSTSTNGKGVFLIIHQNLCSFNYSVTATWGNQH